MIKFVSDAFENKCVIRWDKKKNWNNQIIDEPILKPEMENSTLCKYLVLWGNTQSEEIKKLQQAKVANW